MKRTQSFEKLAVHGPLRELPKMHEHEGSKEWRRHKSVEGASSARTHQSVIRVVPNSLLNSDVFLCS